MTVFKTFLNVIKKYIGTIILYTAILVIFGVSNMQTSDNNMNFVSSKPDILIINEDTSNPITNNLVDYLEKNSVIKDIKNEDEAINDAIFYRDVNYVIYIPKNYGNDIINNSNPKIDIKSTGDYMASLSEMMLKRYIEVQNVYNNITDDAEELVKLINENIASSSHIEVTSSLDNEKMTEVNFYFNFASYSILAVIILVICLVLNSFNEQNVHKRTIISSMNYKKYNRSILFGSLVYVIAVWILYSILACIIIGNTILNIRGIIYILNLLIYSITSLTIAMLISTLVNNKDAISGIVNVVSLGSAFLCGAFVPVEWLPDSVLKFSRILPAYWYINSNELLADIEIINFEALKPVLSNFAILIVFIIFYLILNNIITKRKLKN